MGNDLVCPYGSCGKEFRQPILLASEGELYRESYYACPHCHSKLDLVLKDSRDLSSVQAVASTDLKVHVRARRGKETGKLHLLHRIFKNTFRRRPSSREVFDVPESNAVFCSSLDFGMVQRSLTRLIKNLSRTTPSTTTIITPITKITSGKPSLFLNIAV